MKRNDNKSKEITEIIKIQNATWYNFKTNSKVVIITFRLINITNKNTHPFSWNYHEPEFSILYSTID